MATLPAATSTQIADAAGLFDALVFDAETPPGRHLPPERRGVQGALDEAGRRRLREMLARTLSQT